jgi:hypothetical protein
VGDKDIAQSNFTIGRASTGKEQVKSTIVKATLRVREQRCKRRHAPSVGLNRIETDHAKLDGSR